MVEKPEPTTKKPIKQSLVRAQIAVPLLSVVGIGLFIGLYAVLGNAGVDSVPRIIVSFCIPPAAIAAVIGLYVLAFPGRSSAALDEDETLIRKRSAANQLQDNNDRQG